MLKTATISTLFAMALMVLPAASQAFTPGPRILPRTSTLRVLNRIQSRQSNQMMRIYNGMIDGTLTRSESARLLKDQRGIRKQLLRSLRDGLLFPREIRGLKRAQRRAGKRISRLVRNRYMKRAYYRNGPRPLPRKRMLIKKRTLHKPVMVRKVRPSRRKASTGIYL